MFSRTEKINLAQKVKPLQQKVSAMSNKITVLLILFISGNLICIEKKEQLKIQSIQLFDPQSGSSITIDTEFLPFMQRVVPTLQAMTESKLGLLKMEAPKEVFPLIKIILLIAQVNNLSQVSDEEMLIKTMQNKLDTISAYFASPHVLLESIKLCDKLILPSTIIKPLIIQFVRRIKELAQEGIQEFNVDFSLVPEHIITLIGHYYFIGTGNLLIINDKPIPTTTAIPELITFKTIREKILKNAAPGSNILDLKSYNLKEVTPEDITKIFALLLQPDLNQNERKTAISALSNELHTIILSNNKLTKMPDIFLTAEPPRQFNNLMALILDNNIINNIDNFDSRTCPQLQLLDLSFNKINTIPAHFLSHCPLLKQLLLNNNQITTLAEDFLTNNQQLETLDLAANTISYLPAHFLASNKELRTVSLGINNISDLPTDFLASNMNLTTVSLGKNKLTTLPDNFLAHAVHLEKVNLFDNTISHLPTNFLASNKNLKVVILTKNKLTMLPPDFLANALQLQELWIIDNKIPPEAIRTLAPHVQKAILNAEKKHAGLESSEESETEDEEEEPAHKEQ